MSVSIILQGLFAALPPLLISNVLDEGIAGVPNETAYAILVAGILFLEVMDFVFYYIIRRLLSRVTADMNRDLSVDAFASSIKQDLAFHDSLSSGRIVSRSTTDTNDFSMLIRLTMDVAGSTVQSVVTAIILFNAEWRLALALMAFVPLVMLIVSQFRKLARRVTTRGMRAMANVNATIKETISGISVAKNFRQEEEIYRDFDASNTTSYKVNVQRGFVLSIVFPVMRTLSGISIALLVYFGALSVTQGLITAGAWYMILLASDRFLMPILSITSYWTQVQIGLSAAERIFALIDSEHSVIQSNDLKVDSLSGKIDFNHSVSTTRPWKRAQQF
jgi:ATP-binding cassette subfamily B protein